MLWSGLMVVGLWGCVQFGNQNQSPGASGLVEFGNELFPTGAKRIVILAYNADDYDRRTWMPRPGTQPLARQEITSLVSPPYAFRVDINKTGLSIYLMGFADMDDTGGDLPTTKDIYGHYPGDPSQTKPIALGGYHLGNLKLVLNKIYNKPTFPVELLLADNIKPSAQAKNIHFGLWRFEDVGAGSIPLSSKQPIIKHAITDLSTKRWTFRVDSGNFLVEVLPFAYLDQDNDGKLSAGDAYAIWNQTPIDLEKVREDLVQITIKLVYQP